MICEFIDYTPTPGDKHLGIVTVKLYGKIEVSYKWMERKDGKGCFANPPSFKIGEDYVSAILVDSRIEEKEIMETIRKGVLSKINNGNVKMEQSAFVTAPSYEPKQADDCPF